VKEAAMKRWLSLANRWLDTWVGQLYLASAAAAVYVYAYQHHGVRPGANATYPMGWFGWWDQGQYLKCAAGLAHGSLTPDTYWYPLGYPALGALFYRLWPEHSFFLPDLFLIIGIALLFYQIARKFVTPVESLLLLAVFVFSYRGMLSLSLVEPWNTIPTHFLAYAVIVLVGFGEPQRRNILIAAFCVGLDYLCRPPDAVCAGLIVAVAVFRLPGWKERIRTGLAAFGIFLAFVVGVLLINRSVFASWRTTYDVISANIGFGSYPLLEKIYSLVIDARPLFDLDDTALLLHFPWLILLPPGLVYLVRRFRWGAAGVLLSIAATFGLYFAYNDFWPGNIFLYHLVHYLVWTFPLFALITYVGLREAWKDRAGLSSLVLILPVVLLACILNLRQSSSGRILTASLSDPKVVTVGPGIAWIFFRESSQPPRMKNDGNDLRLYFDYVLPTRSSGSWVLLSKAGRSRSITIDPQKTPELKTIDYGTLKWRWQWRWRSRTHTAWFSAPPTITLLGKVGSVDLAGPEGSPDGKPDEVIQIDGESRSLKRVASWDIETTDQRGRWVSAPNPNGWWLIKVDLSNETGLPEGKTRLRLCFPDYGDFERASAFTLRATDIDGTLVFNQTIQK
jgi:hypothetical protein